MVKLLRTSLALALATMTGSVAAAPCAGFDDVDGGSPFCPDVVWIRNRNITVGCSAELYCPGAPVTRLAMAAFLRRLGEVVLPRNVVWVAKHGGQFQSIQAAVDHLAGFNALAHSVVKVAPGSYVEQVSIPTNVRVEGSGRGTTEIKAQGGCAPSPAANAGVTLQGAAQLSNIHVSLFASGMPGDCAAVMVANGVGTPLRDVLVRIEGGAPVNVGVRVEGGGQDHPLVLEDVEVRAIASFESTARVTGVSLAGSLAHRVLLRDVTVSAAGPDATALEVTDVGVTLDRARITASGIAQSSLTALFVANTIGMLIQNSVLQASAGGRAIAQTAGGTLRIATSLLDGSVTATTSCFGNYGPTMAAVAC